ncbi:MAG: hypothetical protein WB985_20440 [Candidatus Acidiferrales bacterium]
MSSEHQNSGAMPGNPRTVAIPAPTAWPITLAFGMALIFAGLVTSAAVSVLGAILAVAGAVGWFRDVLPQEHHISVPLGSADGEPVRTERAQVKTFDLDPEHARAFLPITYYPISAGIKGGLAGSVAMAVLACAYGLIKQGSIWYPINLLAATVYSQSMKFGSMSLNSFQLDSFLLACLIHLITSLMVGLLYGAMLPMIPRRPILLGGFIAPILWSGLLYTVLGIVNPLLDKKIDWFWFVVSQFGFGIVAGLVVSRQDKVFTSQNMPFALRAGIEVPGAMSEKRSGEPPSGDSRP